MDPGPRVRPPGSRRDPGLLAPSARAGSTGTGPRLPDHWHCTVRNLSSRVMETSEPDESDDRDETSVEPAEREPYEPPRVTHLAGVYSGTEDGRS
jgi:hypothetical protein